MIHRRLRVPKQIPAMAAFLAAASLSLLYSNCNPSSPAGASANSLGAPSTPPLMESHPDVMAASVTPSNATLRLADRLQTASVLIEIFSDADRSSASSAAVNAVVQELVASDAASFGSPCSVSSTRSQSECRNDPSSFTAPSYAASTSVREANRIQACQRIVSQNGAVSAALAKLPVEINASLAPTAEGLVALYQLFYPGREPEERTAEVLGRLDRQMEINGESIRTRWTIQLLMLCESPGWQLL